jgi:CRISPR-associated exonuclease Cas4
MAPPATPKGKRLFTASQIAAFEYCSLAWWHDHFDPRALAEDEELFAELVMLERHYGAQAPSLPDYQLIEQLLVQRGAFEASAPEEEPPEEAFEMLYDTDLTEPAEQVAMHRFIWFAIILLSLALLLLGSTILVWSQHWLSPSMILFALLVPGLIALTLSFVIMLLIRNERMLRLRRQIRKHHEELGLPRGTLVYENPHGQGSLLTSRELPLTGRPDYVVKANDGRPIPILVVPLEEPLSKPQSHHTIQIAAYCLLLEEYFEDASSYGILRHGQRDIIVEYTTALRRKVLRHLDTMIACDEVEMPVLSRQKATKCKACIWKGVCSLGQQKLSR